MKNSKIMLVAILTFLCTWVFIALLTSFVGQIEFRSAITDGFVLFILLMIGWVPALIVGLDYEDYLNKSESSY